MVRRIRRGDPLTLAWDEGRAPPPEAYLPEHRHTLLELVYFTAPDRAYSWHDHPHRAAWSEALRATREPT